MNAKTQVIEHPAASAALTPMDMLDRAVAQGANVETLEKLMALQERWEKNQARKDFDSAVARAKAEIPPIVRNATGHNAKKYVDFAAIAKAVDPILAKHGLAYRFRTTQDDRIVVTCVLFGFGHSEENTISGPADKTGNKNDIQAIGSTLSYLARYSIIQALGLASAEDDDGIAAGGVISPEQVEKIQSLIVEVAADIQKFYKYFKIARLEELPAARFTDAVAALEAKRS